MLNDMNAQNNENLTTTLIRKDCLRSPIHQREDVIHGWILGSLKDKMSRPL